MASVPSVTYIELGMRKRERGSSHLIRGPIYVPDRCSVFLQFAVGSNPAPQ